MAEVIIRIALRYVAAFLAAKGFLTPEAGSAVASDPDIAQGIEIGLGLLVGMAAEFWYWTASSAGQPNDIEPIQFRDAVIFEPNRQEKRSKNKKQKPQRKQNRRAKATKIAKARRPLCA